MRVRRNECVARRDCVTSQSREAGRVELRKTQICNRLGSSRPRAHGIARDCLPLFPFSGNACLAFPGGGCCVLWPARGWEYCQSQRLNCITYYCLLFGCSLASPSFSPLCARARLTATFPHGCNFALANSCGYLRRRPVSASYSRC